jgi:hypothetical protein
MPSVIVPNSGVAGVGQTHFQNNSKDFVNKSKRGGGPRTPEGRASASKNAIKHGAYAVLLEDDSFIAFESELLIDLSPMGAFQLATAKMIAHEDWRIKKINEHERAIQVSAMDMGPSANELFSAINAPWGSTYSYLLAHHPQRDQFRKSIGQYWVNYGDPTDKETSKNWTGEALEEDVDLYNEGVEFFSKAIEGHEDPEEFLQRFDEVVQRFESDRTYIKKDRFDERQKLFPIEYWLFRNWHHVELAKQKVYAKNMMKMLTDDNLIRARAHCQKTLFALRQEYRQMVQDDLKRSFELIEATDPSLALTES